MIVRLVYTPIIIFVKTSILLQYVTLFVVHRGSVFHLSIHILIWVNTVFYIVITFLYLFEVSITSKTGLNPMGNLASR